MATEQHSESEGPRLTEEKTIQCPVYVGYSKAGRRFKLCRIQAPTRGLRSHMSYMHELYDEQMLTFYEGVAGNDGWWENHSNGH